MKKIILKILAFVSVTACSPSQNSEKEGYFALSELIERKGYPHLVEEKDSGEFEKIYYYLDSKDESRILVYSIKDESVVGMGYVEADENSPLRKSILEQVGAGQPMQPARKTENHLDH